MGLENNKAVNAFLQTNPHNICIDEVPRILRFHGSIQYEEADWWKFVKRKRSRDEQKSEERTSFSSKARQ